MSNTRTYPASVKIVPYYGNVTSYDLVGDDGTVVYAGIATYQDAQDRARELARGDLSYFV